MERRLNCYNYIFSACHSGSKCPYGHVIVQDKDEYYRKYEMNEEGTRDNTSPRGIQHFEFGNSGPKRKKKNKSYGGHGHLNNSNPEDYQVRFIDCAHCNITKCENRNFVVYLNQRNEQFICRDCQQKGKLLYDLEKRKGNGFTERFDVYNM